MQDSLVSIIMPTYKGNEKWIIESIDSVLIQSYNNFELIIIHDEPQKNIDNIIQKYIEKDNRIIYIKNKKKFNIGKALNQGIFKSKGKYIARIDDDDIWNDKNKLKKQVGFLEDNNKYGLVGVNKIFLIDEKGIDGGLVNMRKTNIEIKNNMLQSNQFAHSGIVVRKSALERVGIYDPTSFTEDYDLWLRVGKFYKFCNVDSSISLRIQKNSLSHKNLFKVKVGSFIVFWKYKKYYPNFFRALILRIGDFILPEKLSKKILEFVKNDC